MLKLDITKKERMNDIQLDFKFKIGNNEEYEVDSIWDSTVYAKKLIKNQLPGLYYLILWKSYSEEENTWEPASAIQHLWRLTITYHKNNSKKLIVTSLPIDMALQIAKPIVAPTKKCGWPAKSITINTIKWVKKF